MSLRQGVFLDGPGPVNASLPTSTVSAAELSVANIPGLVAWPGLSAWAANPANAGFRSRIGTVDALANGYTPVSGRFFAGPGGEVAYSLQGLTYAILAALDTSGDFTVGLRYALTSAITTAGAGPAMGSYTNTPVGPWWLSANSGPGGDGKLRVGIGAISTAFADYAGPPITDTGVWYSIVLMASRSLGKVVLRVNGVQAAVLTDASIKAVALKSEFGIGVYNANATQVARNGFYRK